MQSNGISRCEDRRSRPGKRRPYAVGKGEEVPRPEGTEVDPELLQMMLLQNEEVEAQRYGGEEGSTGQQVNPDGMSYEQLLELEEKMGKVSKGLSAAQINVKFYLSYDMV